MYVPYIDYRTLTFDLRYKHSGMFANLKYEGLPYPKNQKMSDLIPLVTLLKMQPHDSQSSRENATPSSSSSSLGSNEEVPLLGFRVDCMYFISKLVTVRIYL